MLSDKKQQGFTLIELMISTTLLIILSITVSAYLITLLNNNQQKTQLLQTTHQGQQALTYLSNAIQNAGYRGCVHNHDPYALAASDSSTANQPDEQIAMINIESINPETQIRQWYPTDIARFYTANNHTSDSDRLLIGKTQVGIKTTVNADQTLTIEDNARFTAKDHFWLTDCSITLLIEAEAIIANGFRFKPVIPSNNANKTIALLRESPGPIYAHKIEWLLYYIDEDTTAGTTSLYLKATNSAALPLVSDIKHMHFTVADEPLADGLNFNTPNAQNMRIPKLMRTLISAHPGDSNDTTTAHNQTFTTIDYLINHAPMINQP